MFWLYSAIHAVPSAWSSQPPVGSGALRSNTPMLSSPRKPPWKMLRSSASLRLSHQPKLRISFWKAFSRNSRSPVPVRAFSSSYTNSVAQACTGGLTSLKFHSYAGSIPLGCRYRRSSNSSSWCLANAVSKTENATAWNARSQAANQGYSHLSGIEMMSSATRCRQSWLRSHCPPASGSAPCSASQRSTSSA